MNEGKEIYLRKETDTLFSVIVVDGRVRKKKEKSNKNAKGGKEKKGNRQKNIF